MTDPTPYLENSFAIQLTTRTGDTLGYFSTLTGGSMSVVVVEHTLMYPEGGSRGIYIPSCTSFEPITLSFGVTDNLAFWNWWGDMANSRRNRIDASIFALGPGISQAPIGVPKAVTDKMRRVAQWDLEDVWPSRISGFRFDVDSNRYFMASVTLVAEDIKRIEVGEA